MIYIIEIGDKLYLTPGWGEGIVSQAYWMDMPAARTRSARQLKMRGQPRKRLAKKELGEVECLRSQSNIILAWSNISNFFDDFMPGFTPARRYQPAYYSFRRQSAGLRFLATVELLTKGPMFGCRMCWNCLLQETAFICPMECPKGMRNGPCGGSTPERCYVDETRPCIWYKIYELAFNMKRE